MRVQAKLALLTLAPWLMKSFATQGAKTSTATVIGSGIFAANTLPM